ncbi:MAG: phosphomannomutase/phosphoglucomutase [Gammaproteobacteria bacterium]|nr:MAG: phosphomannomutase/phosphoglucomutase [Gammaproteobacteria bacterium]
MEIPETIFKAYDIRGIVGKTLTAEIVREIGRAIGSEARARRQDTVVVGRDGRLSGPEFAKSLSEGLCAAGVNVIDIGMAPTPVLYFATHHLNTGSGVAITGSHNPPDYNGIKIVLGGETLSGEAISALRTRIVQGDLTQGAGAWKSVDVAPDYIARVTSDVRLARPLKIVVDCGNGVAGMLAPRVLRALGCEVTELFCEVDGRFPNHHPDPSQPENLEDLIRTVKSGGAELGLAFDGDGDRLGVVTAEGRIIWPDRQLMLYAADVLSRNPGATVIYDVKCTRNLARVITGHGGRPLMWKTGHSLIKAKMKETGALLAGEMSGHVFFKERWYGFDDGLYTAARLLEILSRDARHPGAVFNALPETVNTPELKLEMREGEHFKLMRRLQESADFPGAKLTTLDGVRADFEDGWGLARPSNTTPTVIIRFEAENKAALARIQNEFRAALLKLDPDLKLPF